MKNTDPGFWKYFWAYLLICSGTVLIVTNIIDRAFFGKKESLTVGIFCIWMGVIFLAIIKKSHSGPPQDNTGKK